MIRAPTFRRSTQRQEPHPPTTEYRRAAELTQRGDSRLVFDQENEAFEQMPLPVNTSDFSAACPQFIPAFSKDHQMIGLVSNRGYSCQYKKVISLANIDIRYAQEGTEVYVLYGSEGHRQTMIRATVTRTPYKADRRK